MGGLTLALHSFFTSLLVSALVEAAPARPPAPAATEPAPRAPARLQRGFLRVEGMAAPQRAELVDALGLRVPHLAFEPFEAAAGAELGDGVAFVDVHPVLTTDGSPGAAYDLTIVVSDGRAFDRRLQAGADEPETVRLLASTIANLLLAIEAGAVEADRGDVPLPTPVAPPAPCDCECPAAPVCPAPSQVAAAPPPATPPRVELGPTLSLVTITGLGAPASADRFAGFGAHVGVHARLRRGLLLGLGLRTAGRSATAGNRVVRQRFALGAGYELRRDGWSLEASLWGTVEPWWLVGAPIEPAPRPQWGLVARLAPSFHRAGLAGGRMALSVGPTLELGASAALGGGGAEIGLVVVTDPDAVVLRRLRVGGLELATGLGATLWLGLPRPRP